MEKNTYKILSFLGILYILILIVPLTLAQSHSTNVYVCEDGVFSNKGNYDLDEFCSYDTSGEDLCWCNDEDENFYENILI